MGGRSTKVRESESRESIENRVSLIRDPLGRIIASLKSRGLGRYSVSTRALADYGTQTIHMAEYNAQTVKSKDDANKIFYPRFTKHHSTQTTRFSQAQTIPESEILAGKNKAVQVEPPRRIIGPLGPMSYVQTQTIEEEFLEPKYYSSEVKRKDDAFIADDKRFIVRYTENEDVIISREPESEKPKGWPYTVPVEPTLSELQLKLLYSEWKDDDEIEKQLQKVMERTNKQCLLKGGENERKKNPKWNKKKQSKVKEHGSVIQDKAKNGSIRKSGKGTKKQDEMKEKSMGSGKWEKEGVKRGRKNAVTKKKLFGMFC